MTEWSGAPHAILHDRYQAALAAIYDTVEHAVNESMSSDLNNGDLNSARSHAAEAIEKITDNILFNLNVLQLDANFEYIKYFNAKAGTVPPFELMRALRLSIDEYIAENDMTMAEQNLQAARVEINSALYALNHEGQAINWQSPEMIIWGCAAALAAYYLVEQIAEICGNKLGEFSDYFF